MRRAAQGRAMATRFRRFVRPRRRGRRNRRHLRPLRLVIAGELVERIAWKVVAELLAAWIRDHDGETRCVLVRAPRVRLEELRSRALLCVELEGELAGLALA